MYSVVLMMAMTTGGEAAEFGRGCRGCRSACNACNACHCGGGCRRVRGCKKHSCHGCYVSCHGSCYYSAPVSHCAGVAYSAPVVDCTAGHVVVPAAPATNAQPATTVPAAANGAVLSTPLNGQVVYSSTPVSVTYGTPVTVTRYYSYGAPISYSGTITSTVPSGVIVNGGYSNGYVLVGR